ncbi:hypothetical protein AAVH_42274, partial [Aphelenchoides avenae]
MGRHRPTLLHHQAFRLHRRVYLIRRRHHLRHQCQCGYGVGSTTCYTFMVCDRSKPRCLYDRASNCVQIADLCRSE